MRTVVLTLAPVARPSLTGLDPIPLPADRHPVAVYLASHAPNSRHALRHALELAARLLTGGRFTADVLPWHELRYQHMQVLRTALLDAKRLDGIPHAPATAGTLRMRGGKGNKDRVLVGNPQMGQALAEWLEVRGPMPGPLFLPLTKAGKRCWRRLTDKSVSWILQVRAEQAVVNDFTPHDMRRTCISNLLDSGADLVTVSELAGHASVTTTAKYNRRAEAAKRVAMLKMTIPHVSRKALQGEWKAGAA